MKNTVRNNKGFSLAEVLVASAIVAGVGVSVVNLGLLGGKDKVTQNLSRSANRARQNVEAALKNPTAWDLTTNYGQNAEPFDCFVPSKSKGASAKGCNRNAGDPEGYYNFVILSPTNEKLTFEEKDPTTRVPLNSTTCDVSTPEKSEQCPLRYIAKWRPVCTTYPCENAQVEVQLTMVNDFPQLAPFNPNLYSFKIIKNFADTSVPDACRLLNGVYNVKTGKCTPKYTNKTCPNPYQVVTAVDSEGNVTCAPLYSGTCSASKPMVIGFSNAGQVTCGAQSGSPTTCPANCQGHWSECDKNIPQYGQTHPYIKPGYIVGEKTYIVTQPASNGGEACPYESGHKDYCVSNEQPPIDCTGSWSACSADCGGGNQIFSVTREASNGGVRCASNDGDQRECNTQACQAKVDCVGSWGACDKSTGLQTYSIATQAQNGGAACSAADGATQGCAVNCEGNWGACTGTTPNAYKLFTVSVTPKNGGAACAYVNGATDPSNCNSCSTSTAASSNCPNGWTSSGGKCVKDANVVSQTFVASCPSGHFCSGYYSDSCSDATSRVECTTGDPNYCGWVNSGVESDGVCTPVSGSEVYNCPTGGTLNNTTKKCEQMPTYSCPSGYPVNNGDGTCSTSGVNCSTASTNCVGYWETCSASVEDKEKYVIVTPASGGGASCSATDGQLRNCAATCQQSWCHLNRTFSCQRFSDGTFTFVSTGSSCSDENSGSNPCTRPLCLVNSSQCCSGGWSLDASAGKCVIDATLVNGVYTCPNGGSIAINGKKCAKNAMCSGQ